MHGFGDCASDYFESVGQFYGFNDLADQETFLVAYPQGAYRPEKEDNYWEPGDNGVEDIYENDVYFMDQLIASLEDEFNIDESRVYACGYSNGGMMTYSLACNRSTTYAGIGIMSGTMLEEDCTLEQPVPVIVFHGIGDEVLPYDGSFWYQSVAEVVDFLLNKNDIPSNSLVSSQLSQGKAQKDEYFGNDENSCLTLYTINEEFDKPGNHVWFSEDIDQNSPNKIMWDFFNSSCSSTSSQESTNYLSFEINPNPFNESFIIESEKLIGKTYELYNVQGKIELAGKIISNSFRIDMSDLAPNVYLINIEGNIKRLIKTK